MQEAVKTEYLTTSCEVNVWKIGILPSLFHKIGISACTFDAAIFKQTKHLVLKIFSL